MTGGVQTTSGEGGELTTKTYLVQRMEKL